MVNRRVYAGALAGSIAVAAGFLVGRAISSGAVEPEIGAPPSTLRANRTVVRVPTLPPGGSLPTLQVKSPPEETTVVSSSESTPSTVGTEFTPEKKEPEKKEPVTQSPPSKPLEVTQVENE